MNDKPWLPQNPEDDNFIDAPESEPNFPWPGKNEDEVENLPSLQEILTRRIVSLYDNPTDENLQTRLLAQMSMIPYEKHHIVSAMVQALIRIKESEQQ
jgi:hypothetical protein